jgi:hypothetical protein
MTPAPNKEDKGKVALALWSRQKTIFLLTDTAPAAFRDKNSPWRKAHECGETPKTSAQPLCPVMFHLSVL